MKPVISIPILSLAQKIKTDGIKEINEAIALVDCKIQRVGRSRNYQLTGEYDNLVLSLVFIDSIRDAKRCRKWDRFYDTLKGEITQQQNAEGQITYPIKNIADTLDKMERLALVLECEKYDIDVRRKAHNKHFHLVGSLKQLNTLQFQILNQSHFAKSPSSKRIATQMNSWLSKRFDMDEVGFCSKVAELNQRSVLSYIQEDPTVSLSELCYKANCTMAEARAAFDEFEGF
ncbi:ribosome recycling factor family protein [Vibrio makurazakiensis]|uniref:hypothetical protein n=1 Tax=Vibrio makurazakiensis TaxID=2910250 RepID=UPI003D104C7D